MNNISHLQQCVGLSGLDAGTSGWHLMHLLEQKSVRSMRDLVALFLFATSAGGLQCRCNCRDKSCSFFSEHEGLE